ncbi:GDP-L-fucose synthase [Caulobacter sp. NIBR1757]|uniref:GDP-L-fucose synthase family protein n=1 Tax=Caulobacter sp. NIBR1757 TaxID=3016000 RepID=UPI0022F114CC|nr:GDP-L-fucose synthase [Caulobacter sp. NIBR1757]WGM40052.1 GDP-L-fucose synthase [Caulobacter sp. NIBR1757]
MTSALYDLTGRRVFVAGHRGMVGSAIVRRLASEGCEVIVAPRAELDLRDAARVKAFLADNRIDTLFMAAAKVGGILANATYPADFLIENLEIASATIRAAHEANVEKLLFLGSTCIYPKHAPQPIPESALLTGPLEPTNEAYALAKIVGVKLCEAYRTQHGRDFISAMPTNLYGAGDNYDLKSSHVLPALIAKAHEAKVRGDASFVVWGSGTPRREFLHADDCADALVFLMKHWSDSQHVNVGTGEDISIADLAALVKQVVGFEGTIEWDASMPDGTPRKLVDVSKLAGLGWKPTISLEDGIAATYRDFITK